MANTDAFGTETKLRRISKTVHPDQDIEPSLTARTDALDTNKIASQEAPGHHADLAITINTINEDISGMGNSYEDEEMAETNTLQINPDSHQPENDLDNLFNIVNDPAVLKTDLKGLLALLLESFSTLREENNRLMQIMDVNAGRAEARLIKLETRATGLVGSNALPQVDRQIIETRFDSVEASLRLDKFNVNTDLQYLVGQI